MSRILVIGGTLFIGRALVRRLLARGDEVFILHRSGESPFGSKTRQILCDRNDTAAVRENLADHDFDVVFDNVYDWNRGTTAEHVRAAALACEKGLQRYVFMSSIAVYGEGEDRSEDDPLAGPDHPEAYVRNKAETERMLLQLHAGRGFPAVTLRPPFVYGPENPFYREAFFWDRLLANRPIIVPDDGQRLMQFVLADDVAAAAILASEREQAVGRAYNVGNDRPLMQAALVQALAEAAAKTAELVYMPRKRLQAMGGQVLRPPYYFGQYFDVPPITQTTERARRELGFEPTPFDEGLQRTFDWYRSRSQHPSPDFTFEDHLLEARTRSGH